MKRLKYALFGFIVLAIAACENLYETHKQYLETAEEIYIGRPDSLKVNGGIGRVEVKWKLNADPKISKCLISWNGSEAPVVVDASNRPNEYMSKEIKLPEGRYIFTLTTVSESGKTSLPQTMSGISYGDNYRDLLSPRGISSMLSTKVGEVVIKWRTEEGLVGVDMTYTSIHGESKKLYIDAGTTTTTLDDFDYGGEFSLVTTYRPEKNALDNIQTLPFQQKFPLACNYTKAQWDAVHAEYTDISRAGWTAEANTEELNGEGAVNGRAATILDGNLNTFWHSQWKGGSKALPHEIIVDMKSLQEISSIELARRAGNPDTKTVRLDISEDKEEWITIGTVDYSTDKLDNAKALLIPKPQSGRYIKITVTHSNAGTATSLSEIMFTKKKVQ